MKEKILPNILYMRKQGHKRKVPHPRSIMPKDDVGAPIDFEFVLLRKQHIHVKWPSMGIDGNI